MLCTDSRDPRLGGPSPDPREYRADGDQICTDNVYIQLHYQLSLY